MSAAKRIKEITIKVERLSLAKRPMSSSCFCFRCEMNTNLVTFREALQITGLSKEDLSSKIYSGDFHVIIDAFLNPMLCISSLMDEKKTLHNFRIS